MSLAFAMTCCRDSLNLFSWLYPLTFFKYYSDLKFINRLVLNALSLTMLNVTQVVTFSGFSLMITWLFNVLHSFKLIVCLLWYFKKVTRHFMNSTVCLNKAKVLGWTFCHVNPFKPSILFMGHWQTVENQIRCHRTQHLIRLSSICLQKVLLKFEIERATCIKGLFGPPMRLKYKNCFSPICSY